jgi:hypothetical protein
MTLRLGERVHQRSYGLGEIVDTNHDYVTVEFDDGITRKFAAAVVHLEPTSVPRPARPTPTGRSRRKPATASSQRARPQTR